MVLHQCEEVFFINDNLVDFKFQYGFTSIVTSFWSSASSAPFKFQYGFTSIKQANIKAL